MKQFIYIVIVAIGFLSCKNKTTEKETYGDIIDTLPNISIDDWRDEVDIHKSREEVDVDELQEWTVDIKDKSRYDQSFIDGLAECHQSMQVMENYLIILVDGRNVDTIHFQEYKKTVFKGSRNQENFVLTIKSKNLTSLNYKFQLFDKTGKVIINKSGYATLPSCFFWASETDIDDEGYGYGCQEYWDNSSDCSFSIRIGGNNDERAKITFRCKNNKSKEIDPDDCPILYHVQ